MHWHQLRSRSHVPQVFQVTSHIVGFRSMLRVVNFNSCRCNHLLNFDLYANSLQSSLCENGSFEVLSLHPPSVAIVRRQLQTIQLQQNREQENKFVKVRSSENLSKDRTKRVSPFYHKSLHASSFIDFL